MKFKNNPVIAVMLFLLILLFGVIAYLDNRIEYKLFLIVVVVVSTIFYVFAIFEYYIVEEERLIHINLLGLHKRSVYWKDINYMIVYPNRYFKSVQIGYGMFNENKIVINTGIRNYKQLIKIILDKTKKNPKIVVDTSVLEISK